MRLPPLEIRYCMSCILFQSLFSPFQKSQQFHVSEYYIMPCSFSFLPTWLYNMVVNTAAFSTCWRHFIILSFFLCFALPLQLATQLYVCCISSSSSPIGLSLFVSVFRCMFSVLVEVGELPLLACRLHYPTIPIQTT